MDMEVIPPYYAAPGIILKLSTAEAIKMSADDSRRLSLPGHGGHRVCLGHCGMLSSIPDSYLLHARGTPKFQL